MADIKANTDRMKSDVERLNDLVKRIHDRHSDLMQKKQELDNMWDGPASEATKAAIQDDLNALQVMIENMKKIYQYENTAKDKYNSCENQISGIIAGI